VSGRDGQGARPRACLRRGHMRARLPGPAAPSSCLGLPARCPFALLGAERLCHLRFKHLLQRRPHQRPQKLLVFDAGDFFKVVLGPLYHRRRSLRRPRRSRGRCGLHAGLRVAGLVSLGNRAERLRQPAGFRKSSSHMTRRWRGESAANSSLKSSSRAAPNKGRFRRGRGTILVP
jgi:hypothetical protein